MQDSDYSQRRRTVKAKTRTLWTFAITSLALFMVTLDNLVVTTALPAIRRDLHATLQGLEWTVNAYTLTFAVLLLTGAALFFFHAEDGIRARNVTGVQTCALPI